MRRLMTITALAALAFVGGGCSSTSEPTNGASATTAASATVSTSTSAGAAADTKQVCADVKKLNGDSAAKVGAAISNALQLGMKGDEAGAQKAVGEAKAAVQDWASQLQAQSAKAKAANPELAKALDDLATEVKKLDSDPDQLNEIVTKANTALVKHCG